MFHFAGSGFVSLQLCICSSCVTFRSIMNNSCTTMSLCTQHVPFFSGHCSFSRHYCSRCSFRGAAFVFQTHEEKLMSARHSNVIRQPQLLQQILSFVLSIVRCSRASPISEREYVFELRRTNSFLLVYDGNLSG